jgi:BirA family transcriptional regulator, biotin operon repressor / biotin---[acetyl-CoA-carboxylase] ligase
MMPAGPGRPRAPRGVNEDLARAPDLVAASGGQLGQPMHLLATATSTNDLAKEAARDGAPNGATWVAEEQTAGRGRRGHAWMCGPGEGLLFSVLVRVSCAPSRVAPVGLAVGLAVRDAVAAAAPGAAVGIKWPNDVLVGGRKVAGVLVEAVTMGSRVDAVVVGVGINVHTRVFPEALADLATSVALAAPAPPDRAAILADALARIDRDLHVVVGRGLGLLLARLGAADVLLGGRVRRDVGEGGGADPSSEGTAAGIDEDGRLMVRRDDGVLTRWNAGEVHLVR